MKTIRRRQAAVALIVVLTIAAILAAACGSSAPAASPSNSSSASPKASSPAPSSASPSASASASGSAQDQSYQKAQAAWPQVVAAAQKEGTATIYAVSPPDQLDSRAAAFNKIDPKIQIKFIRATGGQAIERFKAEAATKQYIGSAYMGGSTSTRLVDSQGLAQPMDDVPALYDPSARWIVSPQLDKPRAPVTYAVNPLYLLINTNLVKPADEPKTWKDLADPKWKDKYVLWDPRLPSAGQGLIAYFYANPDFGPDFVRKVLDNARVLPDNSESQLIARGDYTLAAVAYTNWLTVKDGPVKLIKPTDGVWAAPLQVTTVKDAPHANVMKVFLNWLLSKEGQVHTSGYNSGIRLDIEPVAKEAQVGDAKFLRNCPVSFDFETKEQLEIAKIIGPWLDQQGK